MEVVCSNRPSRKNHAAFEGVLRQLKTSTGAAIGKRFGFQAEPENTQVVTGRWVKFTPPATAVAPELLRLAEEELARQAVLQPTSVQKVNETTRGPFSI